MFKRVVSFFTILIVILLVSACNKDKDKDKDVFIEEINLQNPMNENISVYVDKNKKEKAFLKVGDTYDVVVSINPEYADMKDLTWISNNKKIVTVLNGKITGIGKGEAEIYAYSGDGSGIKSNIIYIEVFDDINEVVFPSDNETTDEMIFEPYVEGELPILD